MAGFLDSIKDIFFKPNTPQASDVEVLKLYISEMFLKYDKRNTRQGERIMATLDDVKAAIAAEKLETLAAIQALKDQLLNGLTVTAQDLDALIVQIQGIYEAPAVEVPAEPV
jgi:hypothetical protein